MAALTENVAYTTRRANLVVVPLVANGKLFKGSLVTVLAGLAKAAVAEANAVFAGLATEPVDNTGGAAGDKTVEVISGEQLLLDGTGFTQASVGQQAYVADSGSVTTTAGTNPVYVGRITEFVSATQVWVDPRLPKLV